MLWELSRDLTHEMLNSADISSLKAELKGNPAERPLPQLFLSVSAGGGVYIARALQFGGTEKNWSVGLHTPRKNIGCIFFFFPCKLDGDTGTWWGAGSCLSLLLFGQSELLDESSSQALHCTSGQALCVPPHNYGSSHPRWITISQSAFLLKSAAWKDLMLRSKLVMF